MRTVIGTLRNGGVGAMLCAATACGAGTGSAPAGQQHDHRMRPLEIDHLMIHVASGAAERAALTRAGFTIAPGVNQHEGQGSASVTVELANGFFELTWRDTSVIVAPGLEKVAQRFERMGEWRTSGWSPFGIGLRRGRAAPDSLPFATRAVRGPWMAPGAALEILSAASDTAGPRLWVVPRSMAANGVPESDSERRRLAQKVSFVHANHAHAITAVKVTAPGGALTPATAQAAEFSPAVFAPGRAWLLEITFDGGRRGISHDLRPDLPLLCHF
jgi:hypothetical protein